MGATQQLKAVSRPASAHQLHQSEAVARRHWGEIWDLFDKNGDNYLSVDEMSDLVKRCIVDTLEKQLMTGFAALFFKHDSPAVRAARVDAVSARLLTGLDSVVKDALAVVDVNKTGRVAKEEFLDLFPGWLRASLDEPSPRMKQLANMPPEQAWGQWWTDSDKNGDGVLEPREVVDVVRASVKFVMETEARSGFVPLWFSDHSPEEQDQALKAATDEVLSNLDELTALAMEAMDINANGLIEKAEFFAKFPVWLQRTYEQIVEGHITSRA